MINKKIKGIIILFLFVLGILNLNSNDCYAASFSSENKGTKINYEIKKILEKHKVNGIVLVNGNQGENFKVLSNNPVGPISQYEVKTEKYFPIASLQKIITAKLIYCLISEKKINLDMHLNQFYPQIKYSSQISLWQLMAHESGIQDGGKIPKKPLVNETDRIKYFMNNFSVSKRHVWNYASTNYDLLASIIRNQTHSNYYYFMKRKIVLPYKLYGLKPFNKVKNENKVLPLMASTKKMRFVQKIISYSDILSLIQILPFKPNFIQFINFMNFDSDNLMYHFLSWDRDRNISKFLGAGDIVATPKCYWHFVYKTLLNNPHFLAKLHKEAIRTKSGYFGGCYFRKNFVSANGIVGLYNYCSFTADYKNKRMIMLFSNNKDFRKMKGIQKEINSLYFSTKVK